MVSSQIGVGNSNEGGNPHCARCSALPTIVSANFTDRNKAIKRNSQCTVKTYSRLYKCINMRHGGSRTTYKLSNGSLLWLSSLYTDSRTSLRCSQSTSICDGEENATAARSSTLSITRSRVVTTQVLVISSTKQGN